MACIFRSVDQLKSTIVFAAASIEYLTDCYSPTDNPEPKKEAVDNWRDNVEKKWREVGEDIFNVNHHFDVYANTLEGESNGLDFLLEIFNANAK